MNKEEIDNLWIGDKLISIKSGLRGRFEGIHKSGKIRVKNNNKIHLIPRENLMPDDTEEEDVDLEFLSERKTLRFPAEIKDTIDLHIEKLRPDLLNALPERIVDIQIKAFTNQLSIWKDSGYKIVTVIHGKGAGVLRAHIRELLRFEPSIQSFQSINNDGATQIVFY